MTPADPALAAFLQRHGLVDDPASVRVETLAGGVASDIVRVRTGGTAIVVKRALGRLRVAQVWEVPVARNAHEVAWLRRAAAVVPGCAPAVLAHDPDQGLFAMPFLPHPVWKAELAAGHADAGFAAAVGRTLAAIHAATAADPATPRDFAHQPLFVAIRLDPYLRATARVHADLAGPLHRMADGLAAARIALVHGDVSPKNILCGPILGDPILGDANAMPVFLDAECACCGDPAFDAAFCLTHLLLKPFLAPAATTRLLACFDALAAAWLAGVTWEARETAERRTAAMVPALMLARIDGKSPVEYVTAPWQRALVRAFARRHLLAAVPSLAALRSDWQQHGTTFRET